VEFTLVKCHYCSRFRPVWRVHRLGSDERPAQSICDYCLHWHNAALELLAGRALPGCQNCGLSSETLREILSQGDAAVEVRMYVVPRDGIYQVLCPTCVRPYVAKRADLYRGTPFGTEVLKL
jgi:hypothetical protein